MIDMRKTTIGASMFVESVLSSFVFEEMNSTQGKMLKVWLPTDKFSAGQLWAAATCLALLPYMNIDT